MKTTEERQSVVVNANHEHRKRMSKWDRIAVFATNGVGTMKFFAIIFLWTISWLAWNTLAPVKLRFDPFPAFVLWLFFSNMIQIFLMPLIMIGQNIQGKHAEIRADSDYHVNLKAEKEIEDIHGHIEHIHEHLEIQEKQIKRIISELKPKG